MDRLFYNNEIVNNLFTSKPSFENIMQNCDRKFITVYSAKDLLSTYYNIKYNRQDFEILLDESLKDQDIDDYINSEIDDKIVLKSNLYYKEVIDHYLVKQNKCKRLPEYYHKFFYKKPLACLMLLEKYSIDRVVDTFNKLLKKELLIYKKPVSDEFSIDFSWLFFYRLEVGIGYYKDICSQLEIDVDIDYYIKLYVYMNTCKIEELLKYESTEVKNALKLCYENRA